jgi:dienelactone hydrolase
MIQRLTLSAALAIAVAAATVAATSAINPVAAMASRPDPVLKWEEVTRLTPSRVQAIAAELPGAIQTRNGVKLFRLTYRSSLKGQPISASALVALPDTATPHKGVVMYLRGSDMPRSAAPSRQGSVWQTEAAVYAGNGYVMIAPDYIGFGAAPSPQAFLLTQPNVEDFRKALRALGRAAKLAGAAPLFLTGYSQGGQLSAALHRDLEAKPLKGFTLKGTVAIAGPHELETSFQRRVDGPLAQNPIAIGYVAWAAYTFAWYRGEPLDSVFQPAAARQVAAWFGGEMGPEQVAPQLPSQTTDMLQPAFVHAVRTDKNFWFNKMVRAGETYDWRPKMPLHVIMGEADDHVDPESTRILYDRAKARGGNVSLLSLPGLNHHQTGAASYAPALRWMQDRTE